MDDENTNTNSPTPDDNVKQPTPDDVLTPADDVQSLPLDHPAADSDVDSSEVYQEGPGTVTGTDGAGIPPANPPQPLEPNE